MKVAGEAISEAQIAAGVSAMTGEFRMSDVRRALSLAGVENSDRAADRLLQRERQAGRIVAVNNKIWTTT